jgi:RNA polymerase sigma factor (sigma-70 family)
LKSILLKTIQNKCIDWHRHRKIVNNSSNYIIDNSPLYEYDTDNYVLRSELEWKIEKAIASLPEKFKEAFEMNRFEGLKYQEIATKLNVSFRTIEVRISKALELLRKSIFFNKKIYKLLFFYHF